jgi:hypothetical protein
MINMPPVAPGDYVAWHCDTIHAVDGVHHGTQDSSVLYIPTCPLTRDNAKYLVEQKDYFLSGKPSPDFGGGMGESTHAGRPTVADLEVWGGNEGMKGMGLDRWDVKENGLSDGERAVLQKANTLLRLDEV